MNDYTANLQHIKNRFSSIDHFFDYVTLILDEREEQLISNKRRENLKSTPSAVLFNLFYPKSMIEFEPEYIYLLLEKRSNHLRKNPGDMAFPGGISEPNETLFDTATREAEEEVGLEPENVQFIGLQDEYVSSSGYIVRAVVTKTPVDVDKEGMETFLLNQYYPRTEETDCTVVIPLSHFFNTANYTSAFYNFGDRKGYLRWFHLLPYCQTSIWGLTATMIRRFLDLIFHEHLLGDEPMP
ncbi:MAG: CoA pyrophosphatase [Candidatus Heimdallarchaeota archaeon]|nr:CoA pyrophosphatase [Candidatus Heimdallarchaeota archaeon]